MNKIKVNRKKLHKNKKYFYKFKKIQKIRKIKIKEFKNKIKQITNTILCRILNCFCSKCKNCPLKKCNRKFLLSYYRDDLNFVVHLNCYFEYIINFWIKYIQKIK